jgi:class 3 adenylate cyclase/tetratricopeptide (TPR) repeat protein
MNIASWLQQLGLEAYQELFQENKIDARSLPYLTAADLTDLGISAVGHRRILLNAIATLRQESAVGEGRDGAELAEPSEHAAARHQAERRQLTVMFCDLVASTELSTRLDPEDFQEVMNAYHACCTEAVQSYAGHIAQFVGDGLVAYFGYPQAHEDDAERAVRAGLELTASVPKLKPIDNVDLQVRIGIASGSVVVGDLVQRGATYEETAVGDTPALASRLQTVAGPGGVVISESTRRLIGDLFELHALGAMPIKGFPQPIPIWRVEGEGDAESRFDALRGGKLTPLIGREHEIELLLEPWRRAREGEGQVVMLEGEAGIGKSRLVREMRDRLAGEPLTPLSYYCSPYHQNTVAYPIAAHLIRAARIRREDPPEVKLDKLEALLATGSERSGDVVPLVADLLSIPTHGRYRPLNLPPQHKARRTIEVLLEQMDALARRNPVLAIYEDVTWADPTTLEVLDLLVERIQHLPVLMLITFRPGFEKRWANHAHAASLSLSRLTHKYGAELIQAMPGGNRLSDDVVGEILTRSDGIPLFTEELTKAVIESGIPRNGDSTSDSDTSVPPRAIPATLKDSLMERIDRLAPVREVAQLASVIGREFSRSLLAAVARIDEDQLDEALEQLTRAELIFRGGTPFHAVYRFKHALVQEAAYESLLRRRRQELHGIVAHAIESLERHHLEEQAGVLAYHYMRSLQPSRAVSYALLAGDQAMRFYARAEATTYYEMALAIARELPKSLESQQMQIDAMIKLASVGASAEELRRDEQNLQLARDLAQDISDTHRLSRSLYWLGRLAHVRGAFQEAVDFAEQSLALAEELGDNALAAPPVNLMGRDCYLMGEYERAGRLLARNVDQMREIGDRTEEATAAGFAGISFVATGEFERGLEFTNLGVTLAQKLENPFVEAAAHNYCAVAYCHQGAWAEAIAACEATRRAAEKVDDRFRIYLLQYYEGQAYTMSGNPEKGRELLEDSIALAEQFGTTNLLAMGKAELGACLLALGEVDRVPPLCREAVALAETTRDRLALGMAQRTLAEALGRLDGENREEAEAAISEAIRVQEKFGILPELARSYWTYCCLLRDWGQGDEAEDYRERAIRMFTEMAMQWDLEQAQESDAARRAATQSS